MAGFTLPFSLLMFLLSSFCLQSFAQLNSAQLEEKKCLEESLCSHEDVSCENQRQKVCHEKVRSYCNLNQYSDAGGGMLPGCDSYFGVNATSQGQPNMVEPSGGRLNTDDSLGASTIQQSRIRSGQKNGLTTTNQQSGAARTANVRATTPAGSIDPATPADTEQQAQQDRLSCESVSQQVSRVCADRAIQVPQLTPQTSGEGLNQFCARAQQTMLPVQQQLNSDSENCRATIQGCLSNCGQLVQKYQGLLSSCNGCESQSVYQSSLSMAQNAQSSCQQQSGRPQAIGQRAGEMGRFAGAGNSCGNSTTASAAMTAQSYDPMTGMLAQTAQGTLTQYLNDKLAPKAPSLPKTQYDCSTNPGSAACQDCAQNPNSPSCLALANAGRENQGTATFASTTKEHSLDEFNVGQGMANSTDPLNFGPASMPSQSAGMIQRPANNSGGGIPGGDSGGGGGASASAKLDPAASKRSSPGSPGFPTDIDQGLRGGGGYTYAANGASSAASPSAGQAQHRRGGGESQQEPSRDPAGLLGMDLKQYLPGGAKDPSRGRMMSPTQSEIHGPGVDIWNRITIRMQERCRLGLLYDCR